MTYRSLRSITALTTASLLIIPSLAGSMANASQEFSQLPSPVVISEFQTGGCEPVGAPACKEDPKQEFIELYNQTGSAADVRGWQVQYISASGSTATTLYTFNGTAGARTYVLLTHASFVATVPDLTFGTPADTGRLAKSGGHIQIIDSAGQMIDRVGWGSAAQALVKAVKAPEAGTSAFRQQDDQGGLVNTGDNALDFTITSTPGPAGGGYTADPPAEIPDDPDTATPDETDGPEADPSPTQCGSLAISELVPNPEGSDTGHEYIELRNAGTTTVRTEGCSLQTSGSSKVYSLPAITLQPGEYRTFSDVETGLTLPNSAGGTVYLLDGTTEVQAVIYPAALGDDVGWAHVDGNWVQTFTLSPNSPNIWTASEPCPAGQERNMETNRCVTIPAAATTDNGPAPCKEGQERNAETGRCRNIPVPAALAACKTGQVRNPDTNRCVAAASAASAAQACKAGQERNPETGRCRAITTAATTEAKPCPAGQERNPETKRCRKAAAAGSSDIPKVDDVKSAATGSPHSQWILAGVAMAVAIAYGVYEWRHEIAGQWRRLTGRLTPGRTPSKA